MIRRLNFLCLAPTSIICLSFSIRIIPKPVDEYNLKSLDDLENYIKLNKHLPDIPSMNEVQKNGVELGQMQAKLLKKIEELTLYVIQLKKDNEQMKKEIKKINGRRIGR